MRKYILLVLALLAFSGGAAQQAQAQQKGRALPNKSQRAWLVKDRLYVEVAVTNAIDPDPTYDPSKAQSFPYGEHFANRLGDVIPIRVRIFAVHPEDDKHQPVALDFNTLKAGRLTKDPDPENDPDWVLADKTALAAGESPLALPEKPQTVTIRTPDGKDRTADLWDIKLFVQTKRRPDPMLFWLEFAYATETTPNGVLDWQLASTPDFIISQSKTADNGNDLCMGNTSTISQNPSRVLGLLLCSLGLVLVLVPAGRFLARKLHPLLFRKPLIDKEADTWKALDAVLNGEGKRTTKGYALTQLDVAAVVAAVKGYYGITYGVTDLYERRFAVDDGEELYKLLYVLEHGVLENGAVLSEEDFGKQVARIDKLVPRP